MALRFDNHLVEDAKIQRTPSGGARVDALLTRPGVYSYAGPNGQMVREYRPPEEVFHADSIASLNDATVTNRHPKVAVNSTNWRALSIGHVAGARQDTNGVAAKVIVSDAPAVSKLGTDLREVSCGYEVRLDMTPGVTPEGERYDCVQRDIRYNHVGLGPAGWGRQGAQSALRLDSAGDQAFEEKKELIIMKIRFDGVDFEGATDAEVQAKVDAHVATKGVSAGQAKLDEALGQVAVLKTQLVDANTRAAAAPVAATAAVRARIELESAAVKVLGAAYVCDGKADRDIRLDAIKTFQPEFKADGESDDFVRGVFAQWVSSPKQAQAKLDSLLLGTAPGFQSPATASKNDGLDRDAPDASAARAKMLSGMSTLSKGRGHIVAGK